MRAIAITGLVFVVLLSLVPVKKPQGETLMQCMQICIRYEGGTTTANKATCKSRCAAATLKSKTGGMRDCMGEYKVCRQKVWKGKDLSKEVQDEPNVLHVGQVTCLQGL